MLITIEEGINGAAYPLSFHAAERVSADPSYSIEYQSPEIGEITSELLGSKVSVSIQREDGVSRRYYSGYVVRGIDLGRRATGHVYRLELVTWLWFLKKNKDSRIFQDMTMPEIVAEIFTRYANAEYRMDLSADFHRRDYCVQYNETDFEFVSRLLEEEGVSYWFEHDEGGHTLVISDQSSYVELPGLYANQVFVPDAEEGRSVLGRTGFQRLHRSVSIGSTRASYNDYDYHEPRKTLSASADSGQSAESELEWYEFSSNYRDQSRGEKFARDTMEAFSAKKFFQLGESNSRGLMPGRSFTLIGHTDPGRNIPYKIISVDYEFVQDEPDAMANSGDQVKALVNLLKGEDPYKPLRQHKKPQFTGSHCAKVVGPEGTEVHTDKLGRVKVRFPWDRNSKNPTEATCWIRTIQPWAGRGWGAIMLPRVGNEVVVDYVDGDIDRPVITGQVYNGDLPPPYNLPEDARYTGAVSRSLKFGEPSNANQLTFDDLRGEERVLLHAERDRNTTVERNYTKFVKNDSYEIVDDTKTKVIQNEIEVRENKDKKVTTNTSFKANSVSLTGVKTSMTGVSTSMTGVSTRATGVSTSSVGVKTSGTGVSNSVTGVSSSMTGISNSVTGVSNSVTGVSNSMTGVSNSMTGIANSITGLSNSMTGVSTSATGVSSSVKGVATSMTGVSTSSRGVLTFVTGVSTSMTGVSTSATGMSNSVTGMKTSTTGVSTSTTGVSISNTGLSISWVGVKLKS